MDTLSKFEIDIIRIPTPWTAGPTNCYILKRDEIVIIDTGIKGEENLNNFLEHLKKFGQSIYRILITHGHTDHYGFANSLSHTIESEIFIPEEDIPKTTEDFFKEMRKKIELKKDFFTSAGMPEELMPILQFIPEQNEMLREPIQNPNALPERIDVGEEIEVIPLPGHTSGHVGFFLKESRILFTGDHILPQLVFNPLYDITQNDNFNFQTLTHYEQSLDRILSLEPKIIAPGHRRVIEDVEEVINKRKSFIKEMREKTMEILSHSLKPLSPFEIAENLNPSAEKWQILFIFPVVMCILKELEGKGEITSLEEKNVIKYTR